MDKVNKSFLYPSSKHIFLASEVYGARSDLSLQIADARVVRLLLVLHELDEAVAGLEDLQQANLTNLISDAVLACGLGQRPAQAAALQIVELALRELIERAHSDLD